MTKKAWTLVILALILFASYVYYFPPDWLNPPRIDIIKSDRLVRRGRSNAEVYPVAFTLDGRYELTAVRVVRADEAATKKAPSPLWALVAKKHSQAVPGFLYGRLIPGMQLVRTNQPPRPLEPDVTYRLYVEAGRARGQIDFQAKPVDPNAP